MTDRREGLVNRLIEATVRGDIGAVMVATGALLAAGIAFTHIATIVGAITIAAE